ncbi:hypothetical protein T35B1_03501 [Salinisphaera shabanensis T35B1]|jgi:hypothetical protein|uniref:Uncharacterized protein n=1 Tax=Salinisphaera shabanensis E1L3A TaxID=1033802 RepID=U2EN56_9GAMM|nr:hypothetical protein [Salinisphaera shabanensis]ERJ19552.1 hypothetical protein SSPSH_001316 [Salinisphaera shabanensis E1L3A]
MMDRIADNRRFWLLLNLLLLVLHGFGVYCYVAAGFAHPVTQLWAIVLLIHILEFPLAFIAVQGRKVGWGTTIMATFIFGFTWWVPTRRGVFHA